MICFAMEMHKTRTHAWKQTSVKEKNSSLVQEYRHADIHTPEILVVRCCVMWLFLHLRTRLQEVGGIFYLQSKKKVLA